MHHKVLAGLAVITVALAGCGKVHATARPPATTATTTPTTAPPTTPRPTSPPTTAWHARSPKPSPDAAAGALVNAWAAGDRAAAAAVATPAAVGSLFAVRYPGGGQAIPRGCSTAFPPIVCTYGPPGGASPGEPAFDLYLTHTPPGQAPAGWYVSSVMTEM